MRKAISPRLAIKIFLNMRQGFMLVLTIVKGSIDAPMNSVLIPNIKTGPTSRA